MDRYQRRFYRDWIGNNDLLRVRIKVKETDLQILTDRPIDKDSLEERINLYRGHIENYISRDRKFLTTLKPIEVEVNAPPIVKEMAQTANKAGVGPMAAVAGSIAQFLGKSLIRKGYREVIIENGGDIFMKTQKPRKILIYAGRPNLFKGLSLRIKPADTSIGICASSGTVGHSLSFGLTDAVVILSKRASLADAVATATANRISSKQDLQLALAFAKSIKGILGAVLIIRNNLISWGRIELVKS